MKACVLSAFYIEKKKLCDLIYKINRTVQKQEIKKE